VRQHSGAAVNLRDSLHLYTLAGSLGPIVTFPPPSIRIVIADDPAMQALRQRYAAALADKRSALLAHWRAWRVAQCDDAPLHELAVQAHRLAGSAGCYGYATVGARAGELDALASGALAGAAGVDLPGLDRAMSLLLNAIDSAIDEGARSA